VPEAAAPNTLPAMPSDNSSGLKNFIILFCLFLSVIGAHILFFKVKGGFPYADQVAIITP
jgi:hypothetical protein